MLYTKEDDFFITDRRFGKFIFEPFDGSKEHVEEMENITVEALKMYREDKNGALQKIEKADEKLHMIYHLSGKLTNDISKHKKRMATLKALIQGGADITACDGNFVILSDEVMLTLSNRSWKRLDKEKWFKMENVTKELKSLIEELKVASE